MSFGQVDGYIVDSCVLLPQPLESSMRSCSSFLKANSSKCLLTSSIIEEAEKLIQDSHDLIIEHFQVYLKPFLERKSIKEISNKDGQIIAEFFTEQRNQFKLKSHIRSSIPNEFINAIEIYLADEIHAIPDGNKIPVTILLASIATQLAIAKHTLESPFQGLKSIKINPTQRLKIAVMSATSMKNINDITHLASALDYQFSGNKWIIFVTTDQGDILSREKELWGIFLRCTSPQWATDYYSVLTRNKAPSGWIAGLQVFSFKQKKVLEALRL